MYEVPLAAEGAPEFIAAPVLRVDELGPGLRSVVIEAETSRELVPLLGAYVAVGQRARVRRAESSAEGEGAAAAAADDESDWLLPVCSAPFSQNAGPLLKVPADAERADFAMWTTKEAFM